MCKLLVLRILWKSLHSRDWLMISFFIGAALDRRGFYSSLFLYQHFKATILQWWDLALKGSLKVKVQAKKSTCPKLFLFSVTRMHLRVFCPENFPLDFIQYCITLFFTQKSLEWKHEQWSDQFKIWIQASIHIRTNTSTMNRDDEHTSYLLYGPKWFPPPIREERVALTECWFFMLQLTPSEACLGLLTVVAVLVSIKIAVSHRGML